MYHENGNTEFGERYTMEMIFYGWSTESRRRHTRFFPDDQRDDARSGHVDLSSGFKSTHVTVTIRLVVLQHLIPSSIVSLSLYQLSHLFLTRAFVSNRVINQTRKKEETE